jgi:hypothetical protein
VISDLEILRFVKKAKRPEISKSLNLKIRNALVAFILFADATGA